MHGLSVIMRSLWLMVVLFFVSTSLALAKDEDEDKAPIPLKEVTVMGVKLTEATLDSVRQQLWNIGGFSQAKSTFRQGNIDKFFAWSRMRDSYYLTFRYNNLGQVVSAKRLYRYYSVLNANQHKPISTKTVALSLIKKLGQPTSTQHKSGGGFPSYPSYRWDSDEISIIIDREGSEMLGKVFIEYTLNQVDPYAIVHNGVAANNNPQQDQGT
jgi:hypothetical protein